MAGETLTGGFGKKSDTNELLTGSFGVKQDGSELTGNFGNTDISSEKLDFKKVVNQLNSHRDASFRSAGRVLKQIGEKLEDKNLTEVNKLLKLISEAKEPIQLRRYLQQLQEIQVKYDTSTQTATDTAKSGEAEVKRANLGDNEKELLALAKSIELTGHIEAKDWKEVLPIIQNKFKELNIELSAEELGKFEGLFNSMKQTAEGVEISLQNTNTILDGILDQVELSNVIDGPIEVTISQNNFFEEGWAESIGLLSNFIEIPNWVPGSEIPKNFNFTFSNKQDALEFVVGVKQSLKDMEDINLYDWSVDILLDSLIFAGEGIVTIDMAVLEFIQNDLDWTFTNGIGVFGLSLGLHWIAYFYLKTKLDAANSGIKPEAIDRLEKNLRETVTLYKSAGFDSEEIKNMETLLRELTEFFPETPEGINEQKFRAKYVYSVLQKWRGTPAVDAIRFGASGLGRAFDVEIWSNDSLLRKVPIIGPVIRSIPIAGWAMDMFLKIHTAPIIFASKLVNKGPQGWGLFNTKSSEINNFSDSLEKSNTTFKKFFDIIDGLHDLSANERIELKREIYELYRGSTPGAKLDPLKESKIDIRVGAGEGFGKYLTNLEKELHDLGYSIRIQNFGDLEAAIKLLPKGRVHFYIGLINAYFSDFQIVGRLDKEAAKIISKTIQSKLGYVPEHLEKTLVSIRKNTANFEAERTNVENARQKFLLFAEYYPGINSTDEKLIQDISLVESLTSRNAEEFRLQMVNILENPFGIKVTKEYIDSFGNMVQHESINTGENRNNARIIEKMREVLEEMRDSGALTPGEFDRRMRNATNFFVGNKTFWQAHLGLIIDDLLNGTFMTDLKALSEVEDFIRDGGSRDVFSHLGTKNSSGSEAPEPEPKTETEEPKEESKTESSETPTPKSETVTRTGKLTAAAKRVVESAEYILRANEFSHIDELTRLTPKIAGELQDLRDTGILPDGTNVKDMSLAELRVALKTQLGLTEAIPAKVADAEKIFTDAVKPDRDARVRIETQLGIALTDGEPRSWDEMLSDKRTLNRLRFEEGVTDGMRTSLRILANPESPAEVMRQAKTDLKQLFRNMR